MKLFIDLAISAFILRASAKPSPSQSDPTKSISPPQVQMYGETQLPIRIPEGGVEISSFPKEQCMGTRGYELEGGGRHTGDSSNSHMAFCANFPGAESIEMTYTDGCSEARIQYFTDMACGGTPVKVVRYEAYQESANCYDLKHDVLETYASGRVNCEKD